jgi:hypothetical protein
MQPVVKIWLMQEDEFEKIIRQKMDEFSLVPAEEIWSNVETRIRADKKKKRFFFFLLLPLCLILTTGGYYLLNTNNTQTENSLINNKPITANDTNTSVESTATAQKQNLNTGEKNLEDQKESSTSNNIPQNKVSQIKETSSVNKADQEASLAKAQADVVEQERSAGVAVKASNQSSAITKGETRHLIDDKKNQEIFAKPAEKTIIKESVERNVITDESVNQLSGKENTKPGTAESVDTVKLQKDTLAKPAFAAASKKVIRIAKQRSFKVGFSLDAGTSDNFSGLPIFSFSPSPQDGFNSIPQNSSGGTSGSGFSQTISVLNHTRSFYYAFGVNARKQLNKKLTLKVGLSYYHYSTKTVVGNKVIAQRTFYDSLSARNVSANEYYQNGTSNHYKNRYYLVQLPVNLQLLLNKNREKPFSLLLGLAPGYLVGSNALYTNTKARVYYKDNAQFKRLQLLGQGALHATVVHSKFYSLAVGPMVQYGFTNMARPFTETSQHLFTLGVQTNLNLQ